MSRTHQLYHTLQESRLECAVLRSEAHRLRMDNLELKTALEAAQAQIALLLKQGAPASVEVICMDARQYESLSLQRAGVKL